jgi:hypothetical protein
MRQENAETSGSPGGQGAPLAAAIEGGGQPLVINDSDFTISLYTIEPTTGKLTLQDSMITGIQPSAIAVHPFGHFAYVTIYLDVGPRQPRTLCTFTALRPPLAS